MGAKLQLCSPLCLLAFLELGRVWGVYLSLSPGKHATSKLAGQCKAAMELQRCHISACLRVPEIVLNYLPKKDK